jgi:hypothetical protein
MLMMRTLSGMSGMEENVKYPLQLHSEAMVIQMALSSKWKKNCEEMKAGGKEKSSKREREREIFIFIHSTYLFIQPFSSFLSAKCNA